MVAKKGKGKNLMGLIFGKLFVSNDRITLPSPTDDDDIRN
jgi:hypothetical protein